MNRTVTVLIIALCLVTGCIDGGDDNGNGNGGKGNKEPVAFVINGIEVTEVLYILQDIDLGEIHNSRYDLVIMDYSAEGNEDTEFSDDEIGLISEMRVILAYMSIGEAEDYRFYWNTSWDADQDGTPDQGAPSWLDGENPRWDGNYKVRYWMEGWQQLIVGPNGYLERVLDAGFHGVYLDLVDAYEHYDENRSTARAEMIDLVGRIADEARTADPDFLIVPQNGEALGVNSTYQETVDGIGREEIFYLEGSPNPDTASIRADLDRFLQRSGFVIDIEYVDRDLRTAAREKARDAGYLQFVGDVDLSGIPD